MAIWSREREREETGSRPLKPTIKALAKMNLAGFIYSVDFRVLVWSLL